MNVEFAVDPKQTNEALPIASQQPAWFDQILLGDCRELLRQVPTGSVDLIVTSPPYADSRKNTYGGIHPDNYVEWFLPIAAELRRVLKAEGSLTANATLTCLS